VADGRYLVREGERESVLVLLTLGAPPPPLRRRRRPRPAEVSAHPQELPLTRVSAIRAFAPFESEGDAEHWLDEAVEAEDTIDRLLLDGIALLNRALYAHGASTADPYVAELRPETAAATRIGFGSGDELAASRFAAAHEVDARSAGISRRQQRAEELRPQERIAGILRGRERIDACEPLLLRARADLNAGRAREAALQLRVGLEALLAELPDALDHQDHRSDLATLQERRSEAGEAANLALKSDLDADAKAAVPQLLEICERILRRRRILDE
jgi:hypothetical protein